MTGGSGVFDVFDNRILHIRGGHGEFDAQLRHTVWNLGNEIEADRITDGGKGNISLAKHIMKACDGDEILPRLCAHTKIKMSGSKYWTCVFRSSKTTDEVIHSKE